MADFEVAIVGAGPAGAWAAYRLAQGGARVAIIDGSHPREKPCGGGVSARALEILHPLSAHVPPAVDVTTGRFSTSDRTATVPLRRVDEAPALLIVSRREFDAALLDRARHAGAEHVARRVVHLDRSNGGWSIVTDTSRLTAGWIIGADGANSLVRRRVHRAFARADLSVASGYFVHGKSGAHIDIQFTDSPPGYLWSFPRPDHLAVGVCGQANETSSAQLFDQASRWIAAHAPTPRSAWTRYSWPIPSLSERAIQMEHPAGDRWLLVGDAAGLVDPITREGIFFALKSAELAASSLGGPGAASTYVRALRATIHAELRKAARMKSRFFGPSFSRLLVRSLQRSERIAEIMARLVSGHQTYRGLRRRLLMTGEFRLALEYLRIGG